MLTVRFVGVRHLQMVGIHLCLTVVVPHSRGTKTSESVLWLHLTTLMMTNQLGCHLVIDNPKGLMNSKTGTSSTQKMSESQHKQSSS